MNILAVLMNEQLWPEDDNGSLGRRPPPDGDVVLLLAQRWLSVCRAIGIAKETRVAASRSQQQRQFSAEAEHLRGGSISCSPRVVRPNGTRSSSNSSRHRSASHGCFYC